MAFQADFATAAPPPGGDSWQTVDLPFSEFLPSLRGRVVGGQPPLRGGNVRQVSFMLSKFSAAGGVIADFREGEFRLAVRAVRVIP